MIAGEPIKKEFIKILENLIGIIKRLLEEDWIKFN